jgi:hypothetical protein
MYKRDYSSSTSFLDLLFNSLLAFVSFFMLSLLMIKVENNKSQIESKAEFLITLQWAEEQNDDIDLYVENPLGDLVFFRTKEIGLMHLDRDDLGKANDYITLADGSWYIYKENREIVSLRGIITGEYTINLHVYNKASQNPTVVNVKVEKINPYSIIAVKDITLTQAREEQTAFRIKLNAEGNVTEIIHDLPKSLANQAVLR